MQDPKSRTDCEAGMCPLRQDYNSDEDPIDLARKSLMRCSMCKNRFYCSAKCQKNDWKEHKWNCSALPVGGAPAATVVEINDEFKGEVKRVVGILKEVADVLKDEKKKLSAPILAPLLQIPSELPDSLRYKRAIEDSDKFPYRLPIITASRLLLIDYVSALDDAQRQAYERFFSEITVPTCFCEMYGPKIVGRPADLSPGEYAMLAQVMQMWVPQMEWAKARKKKEDAEEESAGEETAEGSVREATAEESAGEKNATMRWFWLAVMLGEVYNAKEG
ncbi:hypothetical protein B0H11DRAFT_2292744 [Mycena galericulata]|nr:hypothetical protein B0H11DRAFT_2292744 [Mycena galericulata]